MSEHPAGGPGAVQGGPEARRGAPPEAGQAAVLGGREDVRVQVGVSVQEGAAVRVPRGQGRDAHLVAVGVLKTRRRGGGGGGGRGGGGAGGEAGGGRGRGGGGGGGREE